MPEYYVPVSAMISAGDTLWEHHTNSNGRVVLSRQTNPDDNHISNVSVGDSRAYLGGERLENQNGDLVVVPGGKGYNPPGTVVCRYNRQVVAMPRKADDTAPRGVGEPEEPDIFNRQVPRDLVYDPRSGSWNRTKPDKR